MSMFWFLAFLLFLVIELITINLVSIWFVFGAIAGMIVSYFTDNFMIQLIVFVIISVVTLIITRPLVKKFKKHEFVPTNSDRVIGKTGEVVEKITKDRYGKVKVLGNVWTACSDCNIDVSSKVKVKAIDGVKLIVEKEEK